MLYCARHYDDKFINVLRDGHNNTLSHNILLLYYNVGVSS